jgi:hypothetical protein
MKKVFKLSFSNRVPDVFLHCEQHPKIKIRHLFELRLLSLQFFFRDGLLKT